jgi:predicted nucleotidyltransferase
VLLWRGHIVYDSKMNGVFPTIDAELKALEEALRRRGLEAKHCLEDKLGRRVDVVMRESLHPAIRDRVLREARPVF